MTKTLVSGKYFRVHTIATITGIRNDHSLVWEDQNINYGLAIEKKLKDNNYYVVAFIKPDKEEAKLEDVGFRTVDMLDESASMEDFWEMMQEYKNCVEFAKQALIDLQEKK